VGKDSTGATVSYFKGAPEDWQTGLATYSSIYYPDLWKGIDLSYSGNGEELKQEFVLAPGADPMQIQLVYRGADVSLNNKGELVVFTPVGSFTDAAPVAYQEIDGKRVEVSVDFVLGPSSGSGPEATTTYSFRLGTYDPTLPLVIDPAVLVYCGYVGGSGAEEGHGIAVDGSGQAYITGYTDSTQTSFPASGGPDLTQNGGYDAFVAKVKADGTGLVYCGYVGGSGSDYGYGIAVDGSGQAYITGETYSTQTSFPVSGGPDLTENGNVDAFVAKVHYSFSPSVTGLSQISGPPSGGTSVVITGVDFQRVTAVTFGGTPAASYHVDSETQITAASPGHALGTVQVQVTAGGMATADTAADDFTYVVYTRYQQSDAMLTYLGSWSVTSSWSFSGGSLHSTGVTGAAALMIFTDSAVSLVATTGRGYGKALVSLDGAPAEYVDFYSATTLYKQPVYVKSGLAAGEHTLTIKCAGEKNASSSGYSINLDAIDVGGMLNQAPVPERHQQDDGNFEYSGVWAPTSSWSASGLSFTSVDAPGSAVNITFDGTYLAWYATTGRAYGKAQVSLDGGAPVLVDFYASYTKYKQRVYTTGLLADGSHTLSIYWVGLKNAAATGTRIDVDAFDILGTVATAPEPAPILWRYQQSDSRLTYLGTWSYSSTWSASGGSLVSTAVTGAGVLVDFTGTSVSLLAKTAPWYGEATVTLDGSDETVDFYSAATLYKQPVWSATGLSPGPHTLTIKCAGTKRLASAGCSIDLDALDITGYLVQAPVVTRYQQDNTAFAYTGTWTPSATTWLASGGSFTSANVTGAKVIVDFTGEYLAWYAKTAPWYGKATVTLDSGTPFEVDLYSATQLYKKQVYNTGLLAEGGHILIIQWSGLKRPAASGTTIDVDTFDIVGTLPPAP
jgi:hypothetical protein